MDFLNKASAQLADLFRSMTPGARITAGLLLAVVLVSLGYLFTYQVSDSGEFLFGGQSYGYQYLERIQMALGKAGIASTIDNGRIRVPRGLETKALGALADAGALPPQWGQPKDDAAKNDSPFLSDDQRKAQRELAREKDFAAIIQTMPGIRRASVEFDSTVEGRFPRTTLQTVSINVETEPDAPLTEERAARVRGAAITYFAGTKPENVNIWDVNGGGGFPGSLEGGDGAMGDTYSALKRKQETYWREKIRDLVDFVPGLTVQATVTLSDVQKLVTRTVTPDPKGTTVRTMEKNRDRTQEGPAPAGRPGFAANQPLALNPATLKGSSETDTESETKEDIVVGATSKEEELVPMTPTRVQAVVGVPMSYFEKLWHERNLPADGAEPKKPTPADLTAIQTQEISRIEEMIAGLLPEVKGVGDKKELVTVRPIQPLTPAPRPEPTMSESFLGWMGQYWRTVGMLGLVGFSLLMLRSMIRSAPIESRMGATRVAGEPSHESHHAAETRGEENQPRSESRLARFAKSGASLRDELSDLVHEDTDAAANILRGWIGTPIGKP